MSLFLLLAVFTRPATTPTPATTTNLSYAAREIKLNWHWGLPMCLQGITVAMSSPAPEARFE